MYTTKTIAGYECNCIESKAGIVREVTVLVGDSDKPGARANDGPLASAMRRAAKSAVVAATGLARGKVRVAARYSRLQVAANGMITRRDDAGNIIGCHRQ